VPIIFRKPYPAEGRQGELGGGDSAFNREGFLDMIIIVFGLPGTGKSYFSRQLTRHINAVYLSTDEVRLQLRKQGQYDEKSKQSVYDRLEKTMTEHVEKGASVVIDGTFHERRRRDQFGKKASELLQPIFFIEMKSSEASVKERVAKKRQYSEADYSVYKAIRSAFEPLEKPHLQLESDREDLNTMIAKAQRYIYG
jgi:predicted kinase